MKKIHPYPSLFERHVRHVPSDIENELPPLVRTISYNRKEAGTENMKNATPSNTSLFAPRETRKKSLRGDLYLENISDLEEIREEMRKAARHTRSNRGRKKKHRSVRSRPRSSALTHQRTSHSFTGRSRGQKSGGKLSDVLMIRSISAGRPPAGQSRKSSDVATKSLHHLLRVHQHGSEKYAKKKAFLSRLLSSSINREETAFRGTKKSKDKDDHVRPSVSEWVPWSLDE